jgi:hypothetical protein
MTAYAQGRADGVDIDIERGLQQILISQQFLR